MDPASTAQAVKEIFSYGLLGIYAVFITWAYFKKDTETKTELKAERDARITDAKDGTKLLLELQSKVMDSVNKLSDIMEILRKDRGGDL